MLLYRGPQTRDLKNEAAAEKGIADARDAASAAKSEGFPALSIIFLDIEEGGRLPRTYHAYLRAWASGLSEAGFRSGAYCSGIPVKEQPSATITTHLGSGSFSGQHSVKSTADVALLSGGLCAKAWNADPRGSYLTIG